ncbi:unnamed protein product [Auanema sp. JU1783]|nr:unnamed protein product [Auanema sp. JU1783]
MLDFFLIFMTIAGINYQSAPLFMPNIVVKSLLDIFLILLGCSTIDVPTTDLVDLNRNESQIPISPYTKWQRLLIAYPTLPLWLLLFILLLTVQVRFLLGQWYRTVTQSNNDTEDVSEEQKNPPSYDNCIGNNESNSSSLPSYEEALQNRNPAHLAVGNYKTSITVKCVSEQT